MKPYGYDYSVDRPICTPNTNLSLKNTRIPSLTSSLLEEMVKDKMEVYKPYILSCLL